MTIRASTRALTSTSSFVQSAEATLAQAVAAVSSSTVMTPRRTAEVLTFVSIPPSGDTTGATDTAAIQTAVDAATVATPVCIGLHAGDYYARGLVWKSYADLVGIGHDRTTLHLADGVNNDLIVGEDFATLTGGTTQNGIKSWGLSRLTLDGNRANNSSGWPLRVYGANYSIFDVHVRDGKSGGVWTQWGSGGTNMDSHWVNFKVYNCEGNLLDHSGPHDSIFVNGTVFNDGSISSGAGITLAYIHGQSSGSQFTNVHFWGNCDRAVDVINETYFANCQAEGATVANVRFQSNFSQWIGGHIFGTTGGTELGIEFGFPAVTSSKGCLVANVKFSRFGAGSFPIKFSASAGSNVISGQIGANVAATALYTGTPVTTLGIEDRMDVRSSSPTSLATEWAVPKVQVSKLWFPATDFELVSGTPALATVQNTPVWLFDATAVETVGMSIMLPPWWLTANVVLRWANGGAGTGDVVWVYRYDFIAAGQTVGTYSSLFANQTAAAAQDVVVDQTQTGTLTNVTNQAMLVRIERTGSNVLDTLGNDAYLLGVEFNRLT